MLSYLRVRDFAIIDVLEVELGPGLNVLTGETGAGKSILVDALGLVLGEKARNDLVRTGAAQAEVEALFELGSVHAVRERLARAGIERAGIEPEGEATEADAATSTELVVRRVVSAAGRSRAYVNGRLVTLAQLATLAAGLADISSQHEHHTLVDAASHLGYLDAFGGLGERTVAMRAAHARLASASAELDAARDRLKGRADRGDFLTFQIAEIDAVAPVPGEQARLATERERLRHAERLLRAAGAAEEAIYGRDGSITEELGRLSTSLRDAAALDPALAPPLAVLEAVEAQLAEVARDLGHYTRGVSMDPERLADVDERLHALGRLVRKYGADLRDAGPALGDAGAATPEEAVLAHRERAAAELAALARAEDEIAERERAVELARGAASELARDLSRRRHEIASGLSIRVSEELRTLGMGAAAIHVEVSPLVSRQEASRQEASRHALSEGGRGADVRIDGARIGPAGIDRVEILIAPNPGEEPRPLRRVASGGELSRALLAIKRVLAGARRASANDTSPLDGTRSAISDGRGSHARGLYVFDEVDTGVGGAVAETIGQKLRDVARHDQVLCVTHLAPIAIYADAHFLVKKEVAAGRTRSDVVPLEGPERIDEIARMLGGLTVTRKTRDVAAELLRSVRPVEEGAARPADA